MNEFLKSINFRHACKLFNGQRIPKETFTEILEVGRLAPSSFGVEPTRMVVVQSKEAKEALKPLCWNQEQITTASEVVIYKTLIKDIIPKSAYLDSQVQRKTQNTEILEGFYSALQGHLKARGYLSTENIFHWGALQTYIMATYMVAYASYLGIDTCYIEGFDKEKVEKYLNLDTTKEQVALVLCFGYRAKEQQPRFRLKLDEIIEYK